MDKEVGERIRHVRLDKGYTRDTLSMMSGEYRKNIFSRLNGSTQASR